MAFNPKSKTLIRPWLPVQLGSAGEICICSLSRCKMQRSPTLRAIDWPWRLAMDWDVRIMLLSFCGLLKSNLALERLTVFQQPFFSTVTVSRFGEFGAWHAHGYSRRLVYIWGKEFHLHRSCSTWLWRHVPCQPCHWHMSTRHGMIGFRSTERRRNWRNCRVIEELIEDVWTAYLFIFV